MTTRNANGLAAAVERDGVALATGVLADDEVESLSDAIAALTDTARRRDGSVYGGRNLLALPAVRTWAASPRLRALVEPVLGPAALAVRGLLFDKQVRANWHVGWHRDRCVAVARRVETPGYGPWSVKRGVVHVRPPVEVMRRMLALRIHLDDCGEDNGPLRVVPGSHRDDPIVDEDDGADGRRVRVCTAARGDVLVMRPLLLHASSPSTSPCRRRVVHLEFAACGLPGGLAWHERVGAAEARAAAAP